MPPREKKESSSFDDILKSVKKDFDLRVGPLSLAADDVRALSTGNLGIDYATGIGGFPVGRITECFGIPAAGKTSSSLMAAAKLQKEIIDSDRDEYIIYWDFEHALDIKYAKALGIDVDHKSFQLAQPDNFEQGTNAARRFIETGQVRLAIFDSVAAMTPQDALAAEEGKSLPALQARLMGQFLNKLNSILHANNCAAVFLNHEKEVFDMGGRPAPGGYKRKSTPGGMALKFYASMRISYTPTVPHKGSVVDALTGETVNRQDATDIRVRVVKNKLGPPFLEATVRVRYGRGFDNFWTAMKVLTGYGKVKNTSGYFYFDKVEWLAHSEMTRSKTDRPHIHGEAALMKFADEHPLWRDLVVKEAEATLAQGGAPQSVEPEEEDLIDSPFGDDE
jgi:recombination protein RecA